jgi:hypothetical protein
LSEAAYVTHAIYGTSNQPAKGATRQNKIIVARIASQRKTISIKAHNGKCSPKNIHVQLRLRTNWNINKDKGTAAAVKLPLRLHTSQAAMPIRIYRSVHTGPKT